MNPSKRHKFLQFSWCTVASLVLGSTFPYSPALGVINSETAKQPWFGHLVRQMENDGAPREAIQAIKDYEATLAKARQIMDGLDDLKNANGSSIDYTMDYSDPNGIIITTNVDQELGSAPGCPPDKIMIVVFPEDIQCRLIDQKAQMMGGRDALNSSFYSARILRDPDEIFQTIKKRAMETGQFPRLQCQKARFLSLKNH